MMDKGAFIESNFMLTYGTGAPSSFDPVDFRKDLIAHIMSQIDQRTGVLKHPHAMFNIKKPFPTFVTETTEQTIEVRLRRKENLVDARRAIILTWSDTP